jgi:hypothetical protein
MDTMNPLMKRRTTMTEKGFWQLLEKAWKQGRMPMLSECRTGPGGVDGQIADYFSSHSLLPARNESIPREAITGMGKLLFEKKIKKETKEAIMIILAHREDPNALFFLREYSKRAEKGLNIFARMAFEECEQWADQTDVALTQVEW